MYCSGGTLRGSAREGKLPVAVSALAFTAPMKSSEGGKVPPHLPWWVLSDAYVYSFKSCGEPRVSYEDESRSLCMNVRLGR